MNDPTVAGAFDQKLDARGLTFTSNIGYNHALQNNWFIEPSAGIVVSQVKVDPFNVTGAVTLPAAFTPNVTFPGTLRVNDINSTLGRLSLRGGTTLVSGNMIWQPFAIGSIYHEFENSVNSSFDSAPFNNTIAVVAPGSERDPAPHRKRVFNDARHLRTNRRRRIRADRRIPVGSATSGATIATATASKATAPMAAFATSSRPK